MKMEEFELTVCIPTFNGSDTIQKCLQSLVTQGVNLKVLIGDNGSKDGTTEMLEACVNNKYYGHFDLDLHKFGRLEGGKPPNIFMIRTKLAEQVKTKYMMFLDDDIKLPAYTLKCMMEVIMANPTLGLVGLHYQPFNRHMAIGASLWHTDVVQKIKWAYNKGLPCECQNALDQVKAMNRGVMFMNKIMALDLNYV